MFHIPRCKSWVVTTRLQKLIKSWGVIYKWRHSLRGEGSRNLWQQYLGISDEKLDNEGRGVSKIVKKLRDIIYGRLLTSEKYGQSNHNQNNESGKERRPDHFLHRQCSLSVKKQDKRKHRFTHRLNYLESAAYYNHPTEK